MGTHSPCKFFGCKTQSYSGGLCKRHQNLNAGLEGLLVKALDLGIQPKDSWRREDYADAIALIDHTPATVPAPTTQPEPTSSLFGTSLPQSMPTDLSQEDLEREALWQLTRSRHESAEKAAIAKQKAQIELDDQRFKSEVERGRYVSKDQAAHSLSVCWQGIMDLIDILPPVLAHSTPDQIRDLLRTEIAKHGKSLADHLRSLDAQP